MEFKIDIDVSEITSVLDKIDVRKLAMKALEDGGDDILGTAKENVHVISGDLKNSGRVDKTSDDVTIRFTKDYADIEEARVGGKYPGPHAYLDPAGTEHEKAITEDIEDNITEELDK